MLEKLEEQLKKKKKEKKKLKEEAKQKKKIKILSGILLGMIICLIFLFLNKTLFLAFGSFAFVSGGFFLYFYLRDKLKESARIRKIESIFPDFLQLMGSNLRAGMTVDRAMLVSSRPEFAPLDKEILQTGKDIATGKNIETALTDMSKRIGSEKIHKTILLLISGIRAGGNLAVLLEQTSVSMRERGFVEKKASSSVLMYVIFIFIAVSVGGPILFSLSSILVETLTSLLGRFPTVETSINMPLAFSSIDVSATFIHYFSLVFMVISNILASFVLGLVSKGEEKEGLKYLPAMLILSIVLFYIVKFSLSGFIGNLFAR